MKLTFKQIMVITSAGLIAAGLSSIALADVTCRDYYQSYIDEATEPAPVIVVPVAPHFHGHYPYYHGGYRAVQSRESHITPQVAGQNNANRGANNGGVHRGGNNGNNGAGLVAGAALLGSLTTSTAVQDAEINDAETVRDAIDEAQLGGGPALLDLTAKVQAQARAGVTVTEAQVGAVLVTDNADLTFCSNGDLSTEAELATYLATQLGVR